MRINENILISSLTTMRLGGPAKYVIEINQPGEIVDAYSFAEQYKLPVFILGFGANTLGRDEGYNGVIIINRIAGIAEESTPSGATRLKIMGGEIWDNVVEYACERDLTGIEALSSIPGLAGAAPVQNIGAYGQDVSQTLTEIDVYDSATHSFGTLTNADLNFSYRGSILNSTEKNRYFVISITLELRPGQMSHPFYASLEKYISNNDIKDLSPQGIRQVVSSIRATKLPNPLEAASSGSFFKNVYVSNEEAERFEEKGYPVHRGKEGNKISAGWLIQQVGLSGQLLHGIRVSDKSAVVLINESAKSYQDLAAARAEIISKVYDRFGLWLEQEPVELA